MSHIALKTYRDRAIQHCAGTTDYGRNLFIAFSTLQGNTTVVEVIRYNEQMVPTGQWSVTPPSPMKLDDFHLFQAGADLFIVYVSHEAISDPNRANTCYFVPDELRGIAVPYPQGQPSQGGRFLVNSDPGPNPNPQPIDYQAIANAVCTEFQARMGGELGGQVQQRAKNGAVDAVRREVLPRFDTLHLSLPGFLAEQGTFLQTLRDGLYQWQKDRNFESGVAVLEDSTPGQVMVEAAYQILGRPMPKKPGLVSRALGKLRGK